jgi:predicted secreted protein
MRLLVALLFLAASARAAEVSFIGFSEDGKYVAFREEGVGAGSGFPWAKVVYIDVKKNDYASPPTHVELDSGDAVPEEAVGEANAKAGPVMRKLGIQFEMYGEKVVVEGDAFTAGTKKYLVTVGGTRAPGPEEACQDRGPGELLRVAVTPAGGKDKPLQVDRKLPRSRACAREYKLHSAYMHRDALLLLVSYQDPTFEGQSETRFMGVTARLSALK